MERKHEPKCLCNHHYHLQGGRKGERKGRRESESTSADKVKVRLARREKRGRQKWRRHLSVTADFSWVTEVKEGKTAE